MTIEQNNSPTEFDIFQVLQQHIKDKKNSKAIEERLCEIEKNIKEDIVWILEKPTSDGNSQVQTSISPD